MAAGGVGIVHESISGMENEEIVSLLKEIRDLQKVQIENSREAIAKQALRTKKATKSLIIVLGLFFIANWAMAYVPEFFHH
jgi:hypothetical protein